METSKRHKLEWIRQECKKGYIKKKLDGSG
jgi:hypothetical protein